MRKLATAVVAAGLFFGGMGVAMADSWHVWKMETPGATFVGKYRWQPQSQQPSGLQVQGKLTDSSPDDGHNVYLEVQIAAYPKGRIKGVQKKTVRIDRVLKDPALLVTRDVEVQLCRDRGALRPDNCAKLQKFSRR
ncbi:hypothetical protein [Streptomyces sp. NPDC051180]|uniref:hypothetical protein n=1 Tax=unclassified Streptomyces TaxID=2593676 RepID=UPI00344FE0F0